MVRTSWLFGNHARPFGWSVLWAFPDFRDKGNSYEDCPPECYPFATPICRKHAKSTQIRCEGEPKAMEIRHT
jgi:hypothetical protein